jgi:acetylornithine/succinyldiaminopimelate/putrescine aminotransferase
MTDWKAIEDRYEALTYARWPVVFERGEGIHLFDESGKQYIDLYGGHCVSILGHSPTRVTEAVFAQAKQLPFYSNVVYHPSRAKAAKTLVDMADGFDRVFFCNSGTEANENAIKLAWHFTGKTHMLSTTGGWHGRTLASISVTHTDKMRKPVQFALPDVTFVPFGDADALQAVLESRDDVAGLILEPIQSISGCVMADAAYYQRIRELCDEHGVILIFDEIQTGVGRTGTFSISEGFGMRPDLITLAKSLGAGFPIGAVLMPERIASTLRNGDLGSTFAGGMMAMAACEATLNEISEQNLMSNAPRLFDALRVALADAPIDLRGKGALIGLKLPKPAKDVVTELFHRGWITGTSDDPNVMRLMPPLITPPSTLTDFANELLDVLQ